MTDEHPPHPDRTLPQLRHLFGLCYPDLLAGLRKLAIEAGEECPLKNVDELHDAMKYHFLGGMVHIPGCDVPKIPRTPKGKKAVSEFTDSVILYAAEHGIPIRLPHEPEVE